MKKFLPYIILIFCAIIVILLSPILLFPLTTIIGLISWISWHFLVSKTTHLLIPRRLKRGLLFYSLNPEAKLKPKQILYLAFLPALFVFSVGTLIAEILNFSLETEEGMVQLTLYTLIILPAIFFIMSKSLIEESGIFYYYEDEVKKLGIYPYIEEFISFGAILGFLLSFSKMTITTDIYTAIGFFTAFLIFTFYPSLLATLLFIRLNYAKDLKKIVEKIGPIHAIMKFTLICYNCGQTITGVESTCPYCGVKLK